MPFYHAIVRPEVLAPADREALSKDVTNVHCDVTGAPRTFVHVLYTVDDANRLPDDIVAPLVSKHQHDHSGQVG